MESKVAIHQVQAINFKIVILYSELAHRIISRNDHFIRIQIHVEPIEVIRYDGDIFTGLSLYSEIVPLLLVV